MAKVLTGKRLLIAKDNKTMFIVIAITGMILGICLVGIFRLAKIISFNARVIGAKQETGKILDDNTKAVANIKQGLQSLSSTKNNDPEWQGLMISGELDSSEDVDTLYSKVLRVIADALPAYASVCDTNIHNTLRTSMSLKLLGSSVESLSVGDDSPGCVLGASELTEDANGMSGGEYIFPIPLSFSISFTDSAEGSESGESISAAGKIQQILERLEKSIRTIRITNSRVTFSESGAEMRGTGVAYWTNTYNLPDDSSKLSTETERMAKDSI